ncbi:MAG TPA: SDR family oxidoreductase [Solirubrobacteraceae bacterium]|nr:SDR family oxidoreductase [Solirubrobacteraceae bacterium]
MIASQTTEEGRVFDDLAGKVAVVSGGARGLGLSMARALARHGVRVGLVDLLEEVETSAARLADELGVDAVGLRADVTSVGSVAAAFARVTEVLGSPSLLINAAGVTVWEDSLDVGPESWRRVIDINLTGTFLCCQALGRACRDGGHPGAIVNVSSMSGRVVNVPQHQTSYNASKAAVDQLTRSLAVEWAELGVRVNAVAPGYFLSDMTRQFTEANPELAERWRGMIPLGRMGEPQDLDGLVVLLCSDASSYLTGQSIVIDGAYTAV